MKIKLYSLVSGIALLTLLTACSTPPVSGMILTEAKSVPESAAIVAPVSTPNQLTTDKPRLITVPGTGKVYIVPDVVYINIGVNTQSGNVSEALAKNNTQSQSVQKALETAGVDKKDIQTVSFNIYPQQQYDTSGQVTGVIYNINNEVRVTVRKLEKLSDLLGTVVSSGANSINSINFDVQDKEKAYSEARQLAMSSALKQAQELAKAGNVQLGDVYTIEIANTDMPAGNFYDALGNGKEAAMSAQVPVSAGQLTLTVYVNVSYLIK